VRILGDDVTTRESRPALPTPRPSGWWRRFFPVMYALIRLGEAPLLGWWRRYGYGNIVELRVPGRRTGQPRRAVLGLLRDGNRWFLGHPNGHVPWTRNLQAAREAELVLRWPGTIPVRATLDPAGELRDRAILATGQHPFPGNLVYRLARAHIRAAGVFFAIERLDV
jgi:hypothetical protein